MLRWLGEMWCKAFHGDPMWPVHGRYICPVCLREYSVDWNSPKPIEGN